MSIDDITKMGISSVPTLVVINETPNKVQNKSVFKNEDAFKWVETMILNKRENNMQIAEQRRKLIQVANHNLNKETSFRNYEPLETNGISDSYAYWTNNIANDIDIAQPKNFLPYGKDNEYSIPTLINVKEQKHKINTNEQQTKLNEFEKIRNAQDNLFKQQYEKNQLDTVINSHINS
jgi:hypothetical protein